MLADVAKLSRSSDCTTVFANELLDLVDERFCLVLYLRLKGRRLQTVLGVLVPCDCDLERHRVTSYPCQMAVA